jgi:hypothetical protein
METQIVSVVALCISLVAAVLAAVAYWRAGGREDVRTLHEELSRKVASGYEDSLSRIQRGQERLAVLRTTVGDDVQQRIDMLQAELEDLGRRAEEDLQRSRERMSARTRSTQKTMQRRVRHLEGRIQILLARADMERAEARAARGDFPGAERLLEGAAGKVRDVRHQMSDPFEEDPAFVDVLAIQEEALASVRARAKDHKLQIDRMLAASDSLLATLTTREQRVV